MLYHIYNSGRSDGIHREGVALVLKKTIVPSVMFGSPINQRILVARLKFKYTCMSIVVAYAPHNFREVEEKVQFYHTLDEVVNKLPVHDVQIIIGDFNAQVDTNAAYKEFVGINAIGTLNDNGKRLLRFCSKHGLCIGNTLFKHKRIHTYTWTSADSRTKNQIDYILINQKWRSSLLDVKTRRGANIGSDHELLAGKLRIFSNLNHNF